MTAKERRPRAGSGPSGNHRSATSRRRRGRRSGVREPGRGPHEGAYGGSVRRSYIECHAPTSFRNGVSAGHDVSAVVGRVGLEPKTVTPLTCDDAETTDKAARFHPATSSSIRLEWGSVRRSPHHFPWVPHSHRTRGASENSARQRPHFTARVAMGSPRSAPCSPTARSYSV